MICGECREPIGQGESYSLSEYGRLHASCLRPVAGGRFVNGPLTAVRTAGGVPSHLDRLSPIYVLRRADTSSPQAGPRRVPQT